MESSSFDEDDDDDDDDDDDEYIEKYSEQKNLNTL